MLTVETAMPWSVCPQARLDSAWLWGNWKLFCGFAPLVSLASSRSIDNVTRRFNWKHRNEHLQLLSPASIVILPVSSAYLLTSIILGAHTQWSVLGDNRSHLGANHPGGERSILPQWKLIKVQWEFPINMSALLCHLLRCRLLPESCLGRDACSLLVQGLHSAYNVISVFLWCDDSARGRCALVRLDFVRLGCLPDGSLGLHYGTIFTFLTDFHEHAFCRSAYRCLVIDSHSYPDDRSYDHMWEHALNNAHPHMFFFCFCVLIESRLHPCPPPSHIRHGEVFHYAVFP